MVIYQAETTANLPVFDVLSRLLQGFLYNNIAPYEHDGFKHKSGKIFHSSNYRFEYRKGSNQFRLLFSSLIPQTEDRFIEYVQKYGLQLGNIKFYRENLSVRNRVWKSDEIIFWGDVLMTLKNERGKKVFLEPKSEKFLQNIKQHSIQKFETLLQKEYFGDFEIEVLKQSDKRTQLSYNKNPYFTWSAKYRLKAEQEMINLILNTGFGSQTMKGFGFIKVEKENFLKEEE
jgi:CRISPR-associated endoribonuclease Cas6